MTTTELSIDSRSSIESHEQTRGLLDHISGDLDKDSLSLLENICLKSPAALAKLISKFKKNSITIKAADFNLVVKALLMQTNLSEEILPTIHAHLLDSKVNNLAKILNMLTDNLQSELPASDTLQAIIQVINNLQIFAEPVPEEQFIHSIMILMLNFHIKQTDNASNYQDSAKWIKSLLSISEKSSLIHLVDYIAIRLNIAGIVIHGGQRNMELTELFSAIDDIANSIELTTCKEKNIGLINNISACTIIGIICKKAPHAIVDVVDREMTDAVYPVADILNEFVQSDNFKEYYKRHPELANHNYYAYLNQLTNLLHDQLITGTHFANPKLKTFIINCVNSLDAISEGELENYLTNLDIPDEIINIFCADFLENFRHQQQKQFNLANSLEFCANKLVNLGFAPRSITFSEVGAFQPLVCKNKHVLNRQNNLALTYYVSTIDPDKRASLVKELVVALLIRYRIKPHVLENQPKPIHRRAIDSSYPVPANHKHSRTREIPAKKFNAGQTNYPLTFFAKKYASQSPKPQFTPEPEGQKYGG